MPRFEPPKVADLPAVLPETRGVQARLFRYYGGGQRGLSVLRIAGVYSTVDNPTQDQLDAAGNREGTDFFLGGHVYEVSDAVAALLAAAGYTAITTTTWGELAGLVWNSLTGMWEAQTSWDVGRSWAEAESFFWGDF